MFDIKLIRDNPDLFDAGLARRGMSAQSSAILELDAKRREIVAATQAAQGRRNAASKQIGAAKGKGDHETADALMAEVAELKAKIQAGEEEERQLDRALHDMLAVIPNLPLADVPDGADEAANVVLHTIGEPRQYNFEAKEHFDVGEGLGLMDFETAAKLSGSRFVILKRHLARLERAIGNYMLDLHTTEFGYQEMSPPLLVRDDAMFGTNQLPKFAEDAFRTENGFWLIPTAEVPLTNTVREAILSEEELPLRMTAYTACFRSEAGSAGRDTRGMIRQHQFSKVELVSITTPDQSAAEHERMLSCAEEVLKRLDLPFRTMVLSTGDMGFGAQKTYDIEVWLPGQKAYREISSCSSCGDFQARRMNARYRPKDEKGTRFVNTLNGSGLAVGRTLVAVLENYQQADGSVAIPRVLQPYLGGLEVISADG
ncbi:MAG: serine--tRNA ligase [Alphaproteobacteria bacterium]|nr:serine--tRNA ligase [Alphaproteobacteria bacterium]MBO6629455.1 serine--tRNA ligase [Alphaproteobacteria bacterium]